jgi:tetratricopeptide (TPR) repeat protein
VVLDVESRVGAVKRCTAATQAAPQLKQAFAALGFARALVSEREEAEAALAAAKSTELIPYYVVGKFWVLSRFHDGAAAAAFLKEATAKSPGFLLGRGYLGEAFNALKRHEDALAVFEAYAADVPKQPWVRAQIGYTLARLGKVNDGIEASKDALSLAPDEVELSLELASRFIDAQRYEEAQRMLESRASDPNARGELLLRLGYAHLMLGQVEDAEKWIKLALERAQGPREWRTRGRARYDLARIAAKRGDKKTAIDELERAFSDGYKDSQKLASEKDFDGLRADPRFVALGSKPKPAQLKLPLFTSPYAHDPLSGEAPTVAATKPDLQKKAVEVRF